MMIVVVVMMTLLLYKILKINFGAVSLIDLTAIAESMIINMAVIKDIICAASGIMKDPR